MTATASTMPFNTTTATTASSVCGLWFAKSSIPGAGLGMYAGRTFAKNEYLTYTGDLVVPIVDIVHVQHDDRGDFAFLWDEYTWDAPAMQMETEGFYDVNAASFGFGAAVNCFLGLVNVDETSPQIQSPAGLHRSVDPGAGAMTLYYDRQTLASRTIQTGAELFASYGENWFTSRAKSLPPIPLKQCLRKGNDLLRAFARLRTKLGQAPAQQDIANAVWENFVWKNPFNDTSRVLFGIPKTWPDVQQATQVTLTEFHRSRHTRPLEWLEQNGICGDHLVHGVSDIPQAGRGAFARVDLPVGSVVAPFPLIHLPDKTRLDIYNSPNETQPKQLLLNYCMGHPDTTLLLCPYGTSIGLINHNQTLANTMLRWADPSKSNHIPEWLNKTVNELEPIESAGLAMELVALRDIHVGEEILLDYGDLWEEAWKTHVQKWTPLPGAAQYRSAEQVNADTAVVRTVFEEMVDTTYPMNVEIRCYDVFLRESVWRRKKLKLGELDSFMKNEAGRRAPCDVMRREQDEDGQIWYHAIRHTDKKRFTRVPREAIVFVDKPYTSDLHLTNAFREPMGIPDELLPDAWRNAVEKEEGEDGEKEKEKEGDGGDTDE